MYHETFLEHNLPFLIRYALYNGVIVTVLQYKMAAKLYATY